MSNPPKVGDLRPYSSHRVKLSSPCPACQYLHGLVIIRFKDDAGFVKCGCCDSAICSVEQAGEVLA